MKDNTCEDCGKTFTPLRNLRRHRETVHLNIKKYVCKYCPSAYTQNRSLQRHIIKQHSYLADTDDYHFELGEQNYIITYSKWYTGSRRKVPSGMRRCALAALSWWVAVRRKFNHTNSLAPPFILTFIRLLQKIMMIHYLLCACLSQDNGTICGKGVDE